MCICNSTSCSDSSLAHCGSYPCMWFPSFCCFWSKSYPQTCVYFVTLFQLYLLYIKVSYSSMVVIKIQINAYIHDLPMDACYKVYYHRCLATVTISLLLLALPEPTVVDDYFHSMWGIPFCLPLHPIFIYDYCYCSYIPILLL